MLDINGLSFKYGTTRVLEDISFRVGKGECIGIIGPNGSGKSTLLKTMSKVLKPSSGRIVLLGKELELYSAKELARQMAFVPQDTSVDFDFTCLEVVLMGRNPHMKRFELEGRRDMEIAREAMALTNTWHLRERPLAEVSGGERQRVIIARALAQEPSVLLLDEPVSHLDINHQIEVLDLAVRLKNERGLLVVVILHDLNLAARYCDRLILLHESKILVSGTPGDVLTGDNIKKAFHANVLVRRHPVTGFLYLTLLNSLDRREPSIGKTVHVVCGAGTGTQLMYLLCSRGYNVTTGVLNVLDSDYDTAEQLSIKIVSEAPFSPITAESYAQGLALIKAADILVISDVPFGWGNIRNLEAVIEAGAGKPVLMLEKEASERDFTNGEAAKMLNKIISSGAIQVQNVNELINSLSHF